MNIDSAVWPPGQRLIRLLNYNYPNSNPHNALVFQIYLAAANKTSQMNICIVV